MSQIMSQASEHAVSRSCQSVIVFFNNRLFHLSMTSYALRIKTKGIHFMCGASYQGGDDKHN